MAHEVFISYSSVNAAETQAICETLEANGIACWIAPRNIVPGADWSEAIISAINQSRIFLLVLSEASNQSPQVKREVERAVHRNLTILTFRLETVELIPALEYFISASHWLDALSRPLTPYLDTLLQASQHLLQTPGNPIRDTSGSVKPSEPSLPPSDLPGNLPTLMTSFVGRETETAQALSLLEEGARLLTLTGPGGIGKTRLALHIAQQRLPHFPQGAWWVDLAPLQDPNLVLPEIATALGLQLTPEQPLRQQIQRFLQRGKSLLVLDNFEHLLPAAEDLDALLHACPQVTAIVTSRAVLNLSGEYEYAVPELAIAEAVALFVQRARQVKASFGVEERLQSVLEGLCRKLDGIPLALELAAAQVKMLPLTQIQKQLSQRFRLLVSPYKNVSARQRTLLAALDWSYDLLGEAERSLFGELSVFVGGFTLEEAEAVCASAEVYLGLSRLREQSLLVLEEREEEPCFRMLETVREYAQSKLKAEGKSDAIAEKHA
ncbi:MAG TPA: TIR domain-containing protein, partial [Chthonomonadaceae bacterium]|nr:TIR domain-containing protein [Chthonomonadaceae bacterium]